jgi:hypothetical protein
MDAARTWTAIIIGARWRKETKMQITAVMNIRDEDVNLEAVKEDLEALGISIQECDGEYEYAVFAWDVERKRYEQTGRPMANVMLAENRFNEYVRNGWFKDRYDLNRVVTKRRKVAVIVGEWEVMDDEKQVDGPQ